MRRKWAGFSSSSRNLPMAGMMSFAPTDAYVPQVRGLRWGLHTSVSQWSHHSATVGGFV